jgi:hypothetical protein
MTAKGALSDIGGFPIGLGHFWLILPDNAINVAASVLNYLLAVAGIVDTYECRRDLAMANQLVHGVRLRENSVKAGDFVGLCRLLRRNLDDAVKARGPMARCMTGHDQGENVGQMDASIGDIRYVLARHCRGR